MNPSVWHAIARRHSEYHALLIDRLVGRAHGFADLVDLFERLKRHGRRIDRHRERLLAILEPASAARH